MHRADVIIHRLFNIKLLQICCDVDDANDIDAAKKNLFDGTGTFAFESVIVLLHKTNTKLDVIQTNRKINIDDVIEEMIQLQNKLEKCK